METRQQEIAAGVCGASFVASALLFALWCDGPTILVLPALLVPGLATGATVFLSFTDRPVRGFVFAVLAALGGVVAAVVIDLVVGIWSCGLGFE